MLKLSEVQTAKNRELVQTYNELTGKSVKGFGSRAAGIRAVTKQLQIAEGKPANGEQHAGNGEQKPPAKVAKTKRKYTRRVAAPSKAVAAPSKREATWRDALLDELLQDPAVINAVIRRLFNRD